MSQLKKLADDTQFAICLLAVIAVWFWYTLWGKIQKLQKRYEAKKNDSTKKRNENRDGIIVFTILAVSCSWMLLNYGHQSAIWVLLVASILMVGYFLIQGLAQLIDSDGKEGKPI